MRTIEVIVRDNDGSVMGENIRDCPEGREFEVIGSFIDYLDSVLVLKRPKP